MKDNLSLWGMKILGKEDFLQLSVAGRLEYLCSLGCLAASSHNTQPWRFTLNEGEFEIKVELNKERVLGVSDVKGRQAVISLGCAVENIAIGARCLGFEPEFEIFEVSKQRVLPLKDGEENDFVAIVGLKFRKCDDIDMNIALYEAIFKRMINRAEYNPAYKLEEDVLEELKNSLVDPKLRLHMIAGWGRKQLVANFQEQADKYVMEDRDFSKELGDWVLPNDTDLGVGMPGYGWGLNDRNARDLHLKLKGEKEIYPDDIAGFAKAGKLGLKSASALVCIAGDDEIESWVNAGRTMQRMGLILEKHGLQYAVHAAIVEVGWVNKLFATLGMLENKRLLVLFRVGKVKREEDLLRGHAPRLNIQEVVNKL